MNIDVLISKYLDGELTPDEDIMLRKALSENKELKSQFNLDTNLHFAIKDDAAKIKPSKELIQKTEDLILMKILANAHIQNEAPIYKINFTRFSTLIAAMVIFSIFQISHLQKNFEGFNYSELNNNLELRNNNQEIIAKNIPKHLKNQETIVKKSKTNKSNQNLNVVALNDNQNLFVNKDNFNLDEQVSTIINSKSDNHDNIINEINQANQSNSSKSILSNNSKDNFEEKKSKSIVSFYDNQLGNSSNNPNQFGNFGNQINNLDLLPSNTDVIVSSFLGNDFAGTSNVNNGISKLANFSQSIAYSIQNNHRIGVEMGYTEFSYNDRVMVYVPIGKIDNSEIEIKNNPDDESGFIKVPIVTQRNQQFYWGAAFYENVLFSNFYASLIGRVGLGATNVGLLSYGRIYLNYNLYKGIYITFGSEARIFKNEYVVQRNKIQDWRGTGSLIYGLQFKF